MTLENPDKKPVEMTGKTPGWTAFIFGAGWVSIYVNGRMISSHREKTLTQQATVDFYLADGWTLAQEARP